MRVRAESQSIRCDITGSSLSSSDALGGISFVGEGIIEWIGETEFERANADVLKLLRVGNSCTWSIHSVAAGLRNLQDFGKLKQFEHDLSLAHDTGFGLATIHGGDLFLSLHPRDVDLQACQRMLRDALNYLHLSLEVCAHFWGFRVPEHQSSLTTSDEFLKLAVPLLADDISVGLKRAEPREANGGR